MMQAGNSMIYHLNRIVRTVLINCFDCIDIRIQYMAVNNGTVWDGTANDVNILGWIK